MFDQRAERNINKQKQLHGWMETWVLWNDICRCPHEIWGVSVLSQSQLVARRDTVSHGEYQRVASSCVPPSQEAEVPSGALKIIQHGMVKRRSYGSMWQSQFVSLSLSHTYRSFDSKKTKESLIFIPKFVVFSFIMATQQ